MISAKPVMMVPSRREATGLIAIFPACGPAVPSPAVPEAVGATATWAEAKKHILAETNVVRTYQTA